jgi:transposase InsO family protein
MTSLADRQHLLNAVEQAIQHGARREKACALVGISPRTLKRWKADGRILSDRRPEATRPIPAHALTEEEKQTILALCNQPEYTDLPPSQIVPRLADQGLYLASESSFYRVLREAEQLHPRGRAKAPQKRRPPTSYQAKGPNQVWTWDITWLPAAIKGQFFYLYLILDIYSRKVVGWEVHSQESAAQAATLIEKTCWAEKVPRHQPLVLHADNGSAMKGQTLRVKLQDLGIEASFSRPRVSNDNPYSEAIFRTCKYRPDYPHQGFSSLDEARQWTLRFVRWYNGEHRHSAIQFVTPEQRHQREDPDILANRDLVYQNARQRCPRRWTGDTRDWSPIGAVWLNPERPVCAEN